MTETDDAGLPPYQLAVRLRADIDDGIEWAGARKKRFRQAASAVRLIALALSVASTVILGLQDLDFWTGLAFALIAVATAITGIEPFFNWRNRWVLMEEMQYRLRRIRDDLNYALLRTPSQHLRFDDVDAFFSRTQDVWKDTSERWLEMRSADRSPGG